MSNDTTTIDPYIILDNDPDIAVDGAENDTPTDATFEVLLTLEEMAAIAKSLSTTLSVLRQKMAKVDPQSRVGRDSRAYYRPVSSALAEISTVLDEAYG